MRTDAASKCSTAAPRTPSAVLQHQLRLALCSRSSEKGAAAKSAKEATALGVHIDVEAQLNRLWRLIPWESGGAYACMTTDPLHVLGSGVIRVFLSMVDVFICREAKAANHRMSYEDCRQKVEELLSAIPAFPGLISFRLGWWSEEMGKVSSDHYMSFFSQMLFVYVANEELIPNEDKRKKLAHLHQKLHGVCRTIDTKQWFTHREIGDFESSLDACVDGFRWLHEELGGGNVKGELDEEGGLKAEEGAEGDHEEAGDSDEDGASDDEVVVEEEEEEEEEEEDSEEEAEGKKGKKASTSKKASSSQTKPHFDGDGFNIPKVHDFLNFARSIRQLGWARNGCTSFFERTNKALKEADRRVRRDDLRGEHAADVLVRGGRLELQHAESSGDSGSVGAGTKRQKKREASGVGLLGDLSVWRDTVGATGADAQRLERQIRERLRVGQAAAVKVCRGANVDLNGSAGILAAGHSVLLGPCSDQPGSTAALTGSAYAHSYARVYCIVVAPVSGAVKVAVQFYKAVPVNNGRHPECNLRWFRRSTGVHIIPLADVKRREHFVEISAAQATGGGGEADGKAQFLLNPGSFYFSEKVRSARDGVYSTCPRDLCRGTVACPEGGVGAIATCGVCSLEFRWL
jgi:hypothetical protein